MKLTRAQIKESLKSVPMEQILLGVHSAKQTNLTAKQIRFAEEIARGETKAGAYRKAYNTKASPGHQSRKGQELAKREAIGRQVEAFQAAFEAQRYATPVHLRAMTIHQLTKNALNEDFPPAQRVKCLELVGEDHRSRAFYRTARGGDSIQPGGDKGAANRFASAWPWVTR
jgi:hypothetical protein